MKHHTRKGVPIGYTEHWTYRGHWKEQKIAPGTWKFRFTAGKTRHSGPGGPAPGTRIHWTFNNVHQKVIKTKNGHYETVMTGTKRLRAAQIHKRKRQWQ